MKHVFLPSELKWRWSRDAVMAGIAACLLVLFCTASAGAQPTPIPAPDPASPVAATATSSDAPGIGEAIPDEAGREASAVPSTFIDPARLEALQASVVGLVVVWEEPEDPVGGIPARIALRIHRERNLALHGLTRPPRS